MDYFDLQAEQTRRRETTASVLVKLRHGDSISDEELDTTIDGLGPVVGVLSVLDDRFYFAVKELRHALIELEGFQRSRENVKANRRRIHSKVL